MDPKEKAFGNQLWKALTARWERQSLGPWGGHACGVALTFCHPPWKPSFACAVVFGGTNWGCPPALLPGAWPWPWPWPWPWCKLTFASLGHSALAVPAEKVSRFQVVPATKKLDRACSSERMNTRIISICLWWREKLSHFKLYFLAFLKISAFCLV